MTIRQRLEQIAQMKSQIPSYKDLAIETGLTVGYCRQVISLRVRELKRTNVLIHVEPNKCDEQTRDEKLF